MGNAVCTFKCASEHTHTVTMHMFVFALLCRKKENVIHWFYNQYDLKVITIIMFSCHILLRHFSKSIYLMLKQQTFKWRAVSC